MTLKVVGVGQTLAVAIVVLVMLVAPVGRWAWDHDEVHTLVELGRIPIGEYPGPTAQLERMHRLVPVWNFVQNSALTFLPQNEWGTRMVGSVAGAILIIVSFVSASRTRGHRFAWSLLILMGGSQTLLWLAQQNRFYGLSLLWATFACIYCFKSDTRLRYDMAVAVFSLLALFTHNLTVVAFGLAAVASVGAWLWGGISTTVLRRWLIAAGVTAVPYLVYLRPLLSGWVSGNTGGTSPLVSFIAQTGIVPFALALVGMALAFRDSYWRWWALLFVLDLAFVAVSPRLVGNWNPRYGLFFMPPIWVLAAGASEAVCRALAGSVTRLAWFGALAVMLAPKVASHYLDGSRHDFRSAASVVASSGPGNSVVSNWPADLQWYLRPLTGQRPRYWAPGLPLPEDATIVALASNAWAPPLRVPGRGVEFSSRVR
ncbi:MAG: hypothetical protein ABL961_04845 [Vicinamibacterales bacterium]